MRLRPQTERTLRRTAARGVERNIRIQQERNIVAAKVEIALVNLRRPRQLVQVLNRWSLGIVLEASVLAEDRTSNFLERLAQGVIPDREIEFALHHKVDRLSCPQRFL